MAGRRRSSYTGAAKPRHPWPPQGRSARIGLLAPLLALALAGCSSITLPLGGKSTAAIEPPVDDIVTGSIASPAARPTTIESDGEVVKRTIEGMVAGSGATPAAWTNGASGHSGTIIDLVAAKATNGAPCRDFATTFASLDGVRMYRGRICQGFTGPWELVDFAPSEAKPAG